MEELLFDSELELSDDWDPQNLHKHHKKLVLTKPIAPRRRFFRELRPIPYNALEDPALEEFFSRPKIQKHLKKNGWYTSNAKCTLCNTVDKGPIKICESCQRFFHVCCLPSLPMVNTNLSILIIHCTTKKTDISPVKKMLLDDGHFSRVDVIDAQSLKPRLPDLLTPYHAILVLAMNKENPNSPGLTGGWPEPDALGDMLADFIMKPKHNDDAETEDKPDEAQKKTQAHRGGIVLGPLTHWETIGGRWRKHKLAPLLPGRQKLTPHLVLGKIEKSGHSVLQDVEIFEGADHTYHVSGAVNEAGANEIAKWSNGLPLIVVLDEHPMVDRGRVISLNYWPIPETVVNTKHEKIVTKFWDKNTDGAKILSNALRFVSQPTYQTELGSLCCKDCKTGKQAKKTITKVYEPVEIPYIRPTTGESNTSTKTIASNHKDENGVVNHQLVVRAQRDKAIAELHVLQDKFRRKFKRQISFSENKKNTVASKVAEVINPNRAKKTPQPPTTPKTPAKVKKPDPSKDDKEHEKVHLPSIQQKKTEAEGNDETIESVLKMAEPASLKKKATKEIKLDKTASKRHADDDEIVAKRTKKNLTKSEDNILKPKDISSELALQTGTESVLPTGSESVTEDQEKNMMPREFVSHLAEVSSLSDDSSLAVSFSAGDIISVSSASSSSISLSNIDDNDKKDDNLLKEHMGSMDSSAFGSSVTMTKIITHESNSHGSIPNLKYVPKSSDAVEKKNSKKTTNPVPSTSQKPDPKVSAQPKNSDIKALRKSDPALAFGLAARLKKPSVRKRSASGTRLAAAGTATQVEDVLKPRELRPKDKKAADAKAAVAKKDKQGLFGFLSKPKSAEAPTGATTKTAKA